MVSADAEQSATAEEEVMTDTSQRLVTRFFTLTENVYGTFLETESESESWNIVKSICTTPSTYCPWRCTIIAEYIFHNLLLCRESQLSFVQAISYMSIVMSIFETFCCNAESVEKMINANARQIAAEMFVEKMKQVNFHVTPVVATPYIKDGESENHVIDGGNDDNVAAVGDDQGQGTENDPSASLTSSTSTHPPPPPLFTTQQVQRMTSYFGINFIRNLNAYQYVMTEESEKVFVEPEAEAGGGG